MEASERDGVPMSDSMMPADAVPRSAGPSDNSPGMVKRIAITLLVPVLVLLAARVPLPGYMLDQMKSVPGFKPDLFGALALGLNPVLSAFWTVELAALVVPGWRQLRIGGFAGRERLQKATGLVAFVFAGIQSFGVALYSQDAQLLPAGPQYRLYIVVALMTGTFLIWWLAGVIGRHGTANGFSVLIAGTGIASLVEQSAPAIRVQLLADEPILMPLLMAVAVLALGFALFRRSAPSSAANHAELRLREPSSGLVPLTVAAALVGLPAALAKAGVLPLGPRDDLLHGTIKTVTLVVLVVVLTPLFTWLFNRPTAVAQVWTRLHPAAEGTKANWLLGPMLRTGAFLVSMLLLAAMAEGHGIPIDAVTLLVLVAVVSDIIDEARARRELGKAAAAWPVHQVYAVDAAVAALREANIPVFPRGLRHRCLWHFFAPFVPVELLVPEKELDNATNILRPLLLGKTITPPSES